MIQAAGNHGPITENADLIPQSVAEDFPVSLRGTQIRPVKFVAVFQKNVVPDGSSLALLFPLPGKGLVECGENFLSITELQLEGKKRMETAAFLRGFTVEDQTVFGL